MQTFTDSQLHELARKRVEFRIHLIVYCITNGALWMIWWFTGHGYPWPIWPLIGWGIGLIFHYLFDYRSSRLLSEEDEYRKLKNKMKEYQGSVQHVVYKTFFRSALKILIRLYCGLLCF